MIRSAPESDARVDVDPDGPQARPDGNGDDDRATRGGMAGRTFGSLFRQLKDDAMKLVRKEAELAKFEIRKEAMQAAKDSAMLIAAAVLAHTAMLFFFAALALAIWIGFWALGPAWALAGLALAPLIVAGGLAGIAFALFRTGQKDLEKRKGPQHTVATLQEDKQWLQNKMK